MGYNIGCYLPGSTVRLVSFFCPDTLLIPVDFTQFPIPELNKKRRSNRIVYATHYHTWHHYFLFMYSVAYYSPFCNITLVTACRIQKETFIKIQIRTLEGFGGGRKPIDQSPANLLVLFIFRCLRVDSVLSSQTALES